MNSKERDKKKEKEGRERREEISHLYNPLYDYLYYISVSLKQNRRAGELP